MKQCPNCGAPLSQNNYCEYCGGVIKDKQDGCERLKTINVSAKGSQIKLKVSALRIMTLEDLEYAKMKFPKSESFWIADIMYGLFSGKPKHGYVIDFQGDLKKASLNCCYGVRPLLRLEYEDDSSRVIRYPKSFDYAGYSWTVFRSRFDKPAALCDSVVGESIYDKEEDLVLYDGSVLQEYLNSWGKDVLGYMDAHYEYIQELDRIEFADKNIMKNPDYI